MITYGSTTLTSYNTITKIEVYYYKSTSATDLAGGSWSTTKPTWENGKYIWQKIKTTYEGKLENGQFYSESDPINITGQQGATGTAAYSYKLNASDSVIGKTKTGKYTIDKVTFTATYKQGTGAVTAYTGRFKIETTANGTTWTTQYTSSGNESSKEYTIPEDIISIRCSLYQSDGTSTLLDIVTIPVVKDGIDAVGLRDSIPYYLASDKQTGVTRLDQGWTRFKPELTTEKRYLWVYYVSRYSEGDTQPELIEIKNDIVSFENHGDESPVENCVIDIEPVQDLHGYDSPWPAGGGKNKITATEYCGGLHNRQVGASLKITGESRVRYTQTNNVITISNDTTYFLSCLFTTPLLPVGTYTVHFETSASNNRSSIYTTTDDLIVLSIVENESGAATVSKTITLEESARIAVALGTNGDEATINNLQVELGNAYTSYAPYSNICPISGWTGANIVRTGKNLFDKTKTINGYINDYTGEVAVTSNPNVASDYIPVAPNQSYYINSEQTKGSWGAWYDKDKNYISGITGYIATASINKTKTAPSNAHYMRLTVVYASNNEPSGNPDTFSVNYPATDHDYHPYVGNTYSITLPAEAGTVYGGTLDVTKGELVVDRAIVDLGDYDWAEENEFLPGMARARGNTSLFDIYVYNQYPVCSMLKGDMPKSYRQVEEGCICFSNTEALPMIRVRSQVFVGLTDAEIKTALSGVQCCLKIKEPFIYTLTPQEITMLTGQNHIFSDTGQTAISYYDNQASTNPYVDYSATSAFEVADKAWAATQPLAIKTYNDVTITANNDPKGWLYFGTVKPTDYNTPWKIRYKVYASINGVTDSYQQSEVMIEGAKDTYYTYRTYNMISNTNYRPLYAYSLYTLKQAGVNNGYGHLIGIRFQSAYWPNSTYTNYKRTIKIEIIESTNCQITLADTMFLYTDASGTGSTNYNIRYSFDGTTQGYTGSGDRNETNHILNNFSGKTGVLGIWQTGLFMRDGNGTYQNICTNANGVISRTVETTKKANPNGFEIGSQIYYSASSYNANSNITDSVYASYGVFDSRYSLNTTLTANCLTPYQPIYLVGTIRTDGLFYLDTVWWTQTATDSSKVYILIGGCYDSTTSYCRINLYEQNNWYKYVDGKLVDYTNRLAELAATTATAYITDTTNNGIMVHPENDTTSGWSIAGAIELFKSSISYIKLWIDNNIPKIRIGKEDSKHVLIDDDSVNIVDNNTILASFGETARIGKENQGHITIDNDSVDIKKDNNLLLATFGANGLATYVGSGESVFLITTQADTSTATQKTESVEMAMPNATLVLSYPPAIGTTATFEVTITSPSLNYTFTDTVHITEPEEGVIVEPGDHEAVSEGSSIVIQRSYDFPRRRTYIITQIEKDDVIINNANVTITANYTAKAVAMEYRPSYTLGTRASYKNEDVGVFSFAEGDQVIAKGYASHAEGQATTAIRDYSHAEGKNTTASGYYSHSEGYETASGSAYTHAEGCRTIASSPGSHAEGQETTASGSWSHAEGYATTASGYYSHSEGYKTIASNFWSHAQNYGTQALSKAQTTMGKWNIADNTEKYALIIGNGSDNDNRSNALTVAWDGDTEFALDTTASSGTIDADLYDAITALGWNINDITV